MLSVAVLQEYRRTSPQAYTTLVAMYCFFIAAGERQAMPIQWHTAACSGVQKGQDLSSCNGAA